MIGMVNSYRKEDKTNMRAELNTTCDVVTGPSAAVPGVIVFSGPCRFVPETKEIPESQPLTERIAYVTFDTAVVLGPLVTGGPDLYNYDYSWSDIVAIPSGNIPIYQVLFVESVAPFGRPVYHRSHVRYSPGIPVLLQEDLFSLLQEDSSFILIT